MIDKDDVKTAQPFSEDVAEGGSDKEPAGTPKQHPGTHDETEQDLAGKVTQRQE